MKGIDVYSGTGNIDFNEVKASGIEIVYIKATEGITYTDSTLKNYYDSAKNAGLKVGFYHYLRANNPIDEAKHFLSALDDIIADCKYAIDVEEVFGQTSDQIINNVIQFGDYLKSNGNDVVVYTYTSFFKEHLSSINNKFDLWIAEYGVSKPNVNIPYIGFQYSESGKIPGINVAVDLDEFSDSILLNSVGASNSISTINNSSGQYINGYNSVRVKSLQVLLNGLGLKDNSGNTLTVDGNFGSLTEQAASKLPIAQLVGYHNDAYTDWLESQFNQNQDHIYGKGMGTIVVNFQRSNDLVVDGKVGINTLKAILKQP
jgi:GH25 family lysozyme M1 (1,4-beta-N-acetylmuramidase)